MGPSRDWLSKIPQATGGSGIYIIVDNTTGNVVYAGRTKNLNKRTADQLRTYRTGYSVVGFQVNGRMARRGLEQMLLDAFGGLEKLDNTIRAVAKNKTHQYAAAVKSFLQRLR